MKRDPKQVRPSEADLLALLRKFISGTGGRRTGELMRRGWIKVTVTAKGRKAAAGEDGGST